MDYLEKAEGIAEKLGRSRDNRFTHLSLGDRATAMVLWFRMDDLVRDHQETRQELQRARDEIARLKAGS